MKWKTSFQSAILVILTMMFLMAVTSVLATSAPPTVAIGDGVSVTSAVSATITGTANLATPFETNIVRTSVVLTAGSATSTSSQAYKFDGFVAVSRYLIPIYTTATSTVNKAVMSNTVRTYSFANSAADPGRHIGRMRT